MKHPSEPSSIDRPKWQSTAFPSATSNSHRSECISPGASSCVQTKIQLSSSALLSSSTRKQWCMNLFGRGWVIFASNQSCTSCRVWPRKTVGDDEVIGGEDPLVMVVISLVSMMTISSDTSGVGLYSERYSSVHCKKRFRVCHKQRLR